MIPFLASIFRGVHFVLGISAPPPGHNERTFVFIWLGIAALLLLLFFGAMYLIPQIYVRH
jgi:hypothetical protein